MNLREVLLQAVAAHEEERFQALMDAHHYLGALPKIGHTLWYVATWHDRWLALLIFCAAAWKCAARDRWIGWDFRHQYDRLHLLANNARFLILPGQHYPNLASRVLALCERRLQQDWSVRFGHPVWLLVSGGAKMPPCVVSRIIPPPISQVVSERIRCEFPHWSHR